MVVAAVGPNHFELFLSLVHPLNSILVVNLADVFLRRIGADLPIHARLAVSKMRGYVLKARRRKGYQFAVFPFLKAPNFPNAGIRFLHMADSSAGLVFYRVIKKLFGRTNDGKPFVLAASRIDRFGLMGRIDENETILNSEFLLDNRQVIKGSYSAGEKKLRAGLRIIAADYRASTPRPRRTSPGNFSFFR